MTAEAHLGIEREADSTLVVVFLRGAADGLTLVPPVEDDNYHRFRPRLAFEKVTRVYELVDRPMIAVLADMERHGVRVDREALRHLSEEFNVEIAALVEKIHAEAGGPFTIGSPQQLGEILFGRMGLAGGRKGKSGQWSTDQNELERLGREGVPIARLILEWRQLTKLKSTYTDALQEQINPETGRVHTSYSLSGAQTGRLASTDPNLRTWEWNRDNSNITYYPTIRVDSNLTERWRLNVSITMRGRRRLASLASLPACWTRLVPKG